MRTNLRRYSLNSKIEKKMKNLEKLSRSIEISAHALAQKDKIRRGRTITA
jgi:hypothetical protein